MTERLTSDPEGIGRAARLLCTGGLVALPTETVYGLGADARDGQAVARIYEAKGRPRFNPLIVHVAELSQAEVLGHFSEDARRLAEAFWPGPLTLVVPLRPGHGLSALVTAGLDSLGLRIPAHPVAQALLARANIPVAAPSANPSGRISPTTAAHVDQGLGGRIDAILDGGPATVGLESTIVGCLDGPPTLLRPGGLDQESITAVLGTDLAQASISARPTAPGQLSSHYAPAKPVRLDADRPEPDEAYLGFGPALPGHITLSKSGDLREAAARLFDALHALDASPKPRIAVAPVPERGLGRAINDRLRRAAAPRDRIETGT